jgi:nicotinamide mononucleotide adenylyltransferase
LEGKKKLLRQLLIPGIEKKKGNMDPTRAPDFKPPSADEELIPPPDPESKIPKSIPIIPYVLADANSSIDAPFNIKRKKKHPKHHHHHHHSRKEGNDKKHQHIPLNQDDFQPLSAEVSSEDDDADFRSKERYGSDSTTESETRGVQKYQIADLEEVPHGIVRQARILEDYEFPSHRLSKKLLDPNKLPLVIVACGSFSPITYLHLRMFEMALDAISEQTRFEVIGGYYSPVSDNYQKQGLAPSYHRVRMCELACERTSSWLMVDAWESLQPSYTRTAKVLDHFNHEINIKRGGVATVTGEKIGVKIMLLAGGDLIESMGEPNVWADADLHHILGNYGCLIVERTGSDVRSFLLSHDIMYEHRRNILIIKQLIYNDISSTKVRLFIRRAMSVQYLLPNSVIRYIQEHRLYVDQTEPVKQVLGNKE